ncbi:MAG: purine-binding chemotaxis protein CheW [Gammaproteobacteria bacterium]|nr:purine-binding chemotaxis protein CheW [Gammaproteobacteria bacterium]
MDSDRVKYADDRHTRANQDEYLTFSLGTEEYGVDILRVSELRGWGAVTRIPNAPEYVKGVLNLRGNIVPVFDLRQRLGIPFRAYEKETVVIILRVVASMTEKNIGVVVDAVSDVLCATAAEIQPSPDFGARLKTDLINGMISANDKMVMLLDVDKLKNFSAIDSGMEGNAA